MVVKPKTSNVLALTGITLYVAYVLGHVLLAWMRGV